LERGETAAAGDHLVTAVTLHDEQVFQQAVGANTDGQFFDVPRAVRLAEIVGL
jgi:hypothetical protein